MFANISRPFHENLANRTVQYRLLRCAALNRVQNGDCPNDVELGNQGNETKMFAFKETISVILPGICYLFDMRKLRN